MKMPVFVILLGIVLPAFTHAEEHKQSLHDQYTGQGYGMAGCGLGSVVFGQKNGMVQIFAATTNNLAGNQTFAISSGTSNCDDNPASTASRAEFFVSQNEAALKNDIAKGNGETIQGLAKIAHCEQSQKVAPTLQAHFSKIYPTSETSTKAASNEILSILSGEKSLGCNLS